MYITGDEDGRTAYKIKDWYLRIWKGVKLMGFNHSRWINHSKIANA